MMNITIVAARSASKIMRSGCKKLKIIPTRIAIINAITYDKMRTRKL
ncbi:MAG: hypothetical protein HWN79_00545 [Candidatus Lokiarchaeota archaeon]|nr:hypothetical protein [Candidatus Lokiarchaeota archaeon]